MLSGMYSMTAQIAQTCGHSVSAKSTAASLERLHDVPKWTTKSTLWITADENT